MKLLYSAFACLLFCTGAALSAVGDEPVSVTRATLHNGLRVVVVHDPLAPAATIVLDYLSGSNEERYPGQAHALEHMMFRGTRDVSQTQLFEIAQLMGGHYDAQTESERTQFFFTVPARDVGTAIRLEADRARDATISQSGWEAERGAIEQEVTQDESVPIERLFLRTILPSIFRGTPYANDTLGTLYAFNHDINAAVLRRFYSTWYHPNNAVYVIAGDVDGPATVRLVERYFGDIPPARMPPKARIQLQPVRPATYRVTSDQPYTIVAMSFRFPGWSDKDYAASQIVETVLNDQRANLFGLVAAGKTLFAGFQDIESHPYATATAALSVVPVSASAAAAAADLRDVLNAYRRSGLPGDLVEVAKRRAIADAEFSGNSIEGLAFEWNDAISDGARSPDVLLAALQRVTVADANRVFRRYVDPAQAVVAYAVPRNAGAVTAAGGGLAAENNTLTPERPEPLPAWAQMTLAHVAVPSQGAEPISMTLSNGMRVIVIPERVTKTVEVYGGIISSEHFLAPADKQGVADIVDGMFPFGTTTYDRIGLREQLDAISANVTAGIPFSLSVLSSRFDRGVQLLADEELHPAFTDAAFQIVKRELVGELSGEATSPDRLAQVALYKALYPPSDPMQLFPTPQTAESVTLDDVRAYYARAYRPDMATAVVIGDVTAEQARSAFERYFGAWSAHGPAVDVDAPAVPKNGAASAVVADPSRVQSQVQLAQVMDVPRADPDWALLQVANNVLGGGGFGSLLMDDLRVKHAYVYGASSRIGSVKNRSVFTISYACDPDKIVPAEQLALSDLRELESGDISQSRLDRAKAMLMSDSILNDDSFDGIAGELLDFSLFRLPLDQGRIDAQNELGATPQSVRAALSKWILPGTFVRIVEGPGPT